MKRIGILTFPNSPSFGASLQMFALYSAVSELGFTPEIINYINPYMQSKAHIGKTSAIKNTIVEILSVHGRKMFKEFESQMAKYPEHSIHSHEELIPISERYDYMICGSDQVWNPLVTGNDTAYLFDFCTQNEKKVSYAPSFGLEEIPEDLKGEYAKLISEFHSLSVREHQGVKIVKELTGLEPQIVVDPSMLITKEKWERQMCVFKGLPSHYIVKFIFNERHFVNSFCDALHKKHGYPIITIGGIGPKKNLANGYTGPIGPQEWLSIIHNADCVVTDSFHGAAFSIIFNKNVYISLASSTKSRLETLVDTYGLEEQVITEEAKEMPGAIDYDGINKLLNTKRDESLEFLKSSLR